MAMTHIIVDDAQARILAEATETVELRDRSGRVLGYVAHDFSEEDVAIARQRLASDQPRLTTEQVLRDIESLGPG
jgi:hypothetical protein